MSDLNVHLLSVTRFVLFFLSLCLFTWAFFPDSRPIAAGLALGGLAAGINAWLLFRNVRRIADNAAARGKRRNRFGFSTRAAVVLAAAFVALKFGGVNVFAVLIGYFATHVATLVLGFLGIRQGKG